jgi:hypothetical protein
MEWKVNHFLNRAVHEENRRAHNERSTVLNCAPERYFWEKTAELSS